MPQLRDSVAALWLLLCVPLAAMAQVQFVNPAPV